MSLFSVTEGRRAARASPCAAPPHPRHRSPESWEGATSWVGDLQPAWSILTFRDAGFWQAHTGAEGCGTFSLLVSEGGLAAWCHGNKSESPTAGSACRKLCVEPDTLTFHVKTWTPAQQGCSADLQAWVWPVVLGPAPTHWPLPTSPSPIGWVG